MPEQVEAHCTKRPVQFTAKESGRLKKRVFLVTSTEYFVQPEELGIYKIKKIKKINMKPRHQPRKKSFKDLTFFLTFFLLKNLNIYIY